ncbi:MAG TPA: hypothetical protein VF796_24915, partial [Humisphaera sp.]
KEAISVVLTEQRANGFVSGQITSPHAGTVDVKGFVEGKQLVLLGTSSGRKLEAKVGNKGRSISGKLFVGADNSTGKFKIKVNGDAPASLPAAPSDAAANASAKAVTSGSPTPRDLPATDTSGGALDPTIDPATGLPIDPSTGGVVDPSQTPGELPGGGTPTLPSDFPTTGGGTTAPTDSGGGTTATPGSPQAAPGAAAPGDLIGTNYSFLGHWTGTFNFEADANGIYNTTLLDLTDPNPADGSVPGLDARVIDLLFSQQLDDGLISGTITLENFGTFTLAGLVTGSSVDVVMVGDAATNGGTGIMHLDLGATFDTFTGTLKADANGLTADDTVVGTWLDDGGTSPPVVPPPPPPPLPVGEELYHVDTTDRNGNPTVGNFDPQGASIGEDFSVGSREIIINSIGAFDDAGDGFNNTITVAIYNTATPGTPLYTIDLTNANTTQFAGSNFRYLNTGTTFTPITLTTGIYRIVAYGYGGNELAGDFGDSAYVGPVPTANTGSTGNEIVYPISNNANSNTWVSQINGNNLVYPTQATGLPVNRYLAGSLLFEEGNIIDPGTGGGTTPPPPPPPTTITKPANSAYPGGVFLSPTGPEVFGSQSGGII